MFARLAVNVPGVRGIFDYAVPSELAPHLQPGCLVTAPFGKQIVQGVILEFTESPAVANTKTILDLLDPLPVLTAPQIALAIRLAESTLNPLAAVTGLMLPVGLSQQADVLYSLNDHGPRIADPGQRFAVSDRLIRLLADRGPLRGRQINSHFAKVDWRRTAQILVKKGILQTRHVLPAPRVRPKFLRVAQLAVPPQEAEAQMSTLGAKQTLARRQAALKFLIAQPEAINLSWVYAEAACNLADLQELEERGLIRLFENEIFRDPLERNTKPASERADAHALELTPEQDSALEEIKGAMSLNAEHKTFLLYGVTGSGKTEIYLRATEETIKRGDRKSVV